MKKKWYDYLWIWTIIYFVLGFFNILFAWLGMIDFLVPLIFAIVGGNKIKPRVMLRLSVLHNSLIEAEM